MAAERPLIVEPGRGLMMDLEYHHGKRPLVPMQLWAASTYTSTTFQVNFGTSGWHGSWDFSFCPENRKCSLGLHFNCHGRPPLRHVTLAQMAPEGHEYLATYTYPVLVRMVRCLRYRLAVPGPLMLADSVPLPGEWVLVPDNDVIVP